MSAERMAWRPLRWLISRRAAKALLWAAVIVAAAVGANIAGIYEGDPVPDRLDQLQKGNPGGRP